MEKQQYAKLSQKELKALPDYVTEYYLNKNLSYTTSYQYLTEIRRFFDWLRNSGISNAETNKDVKLTTLEHLKRTDVMLYIDFLRNKRNRQDKSDSPSTINRSINALKSLFYYLTAIADNNDGEPYFYRNVMQKIGLLGSSKTLNYRAHELESKMYQGKIKHEFLDFLENKYESTLDEYTKRRFMSNKQRNIAIIALMLGTGARVSEVANTNVNDLNLNSSTLDVTRKGGQRDTVPIAPWTKRYLRDYLEIRHLYNPSKQEKALFLTRYRGAHRITSNTIEAFVKKYSTDFGRPSTPHKFRHTLASELYAVTKDSVMVSQQLGQRGTSATDLYTHVESQKQLDALKKIR